MVQTNRQPPSRGGFRPTPQPAYPGPGQGAPGPPQPTPNMPGMGWTGPGQGRAPGPPTPAPPQPNLPGMGWTSGGGGGLSEHDWGQGLTAGGEFIPPNQFTGNPYGPTPTPSPSSRGGGIMGGGGAMNFGQGLNMGGRSNAPTMGGGFPYDPMMGWRGGNSPMSGPLGPVFRQGGATGGMYPGSTMPGVSSRTPVLPPYQMGQPYSFPQSPGMYPTMGGQNQMMQHTMGPPQSPQEEWAQQQQQLQSSAQEWESQTGQAPPAGWRGEPYAQPNRAQRPGTPGRTYLL
ncbi:MAG: hypothetical protein ACYS6W_01585 [Planctomycetota bacterium]|jgi:hypothetical protein